MRPPEWTSPSFGDLFEIQLGKMLSPKAKTGTNPRPYLRNVNVQWNRIHLDDLARMDFSDEERQKFALRPGDLLVCEGGEVGRSAIWKGELHECYYQKALHRLRPRTGSVDPVYTLHYLTQKFLVEKAFAPDHGQTTIAHLPKERLERLKVDLPPLPEQRKIAAILSSVDETIEKTEAVIAQLEVVKKAMLEELLTRGIPGRHKRFKKTEIGEVPEEWSLIPLGDAGRWMSGGTPSKARPELWRGEIPWVSPKDMKVPRISDAIDHVAPEAIGNGTTLVPAKSILIVVRGMILAHSAPVAISTRPVAFNQDMKALLVQSSSFVPEFLLYWLESQEQAILRLVDVANHGTKRLPSQLLFAMPLPVPSCEEQVAICDTFRSLDQRSASEALLLEALRGAKKAVSESLLGGDIRVHVAESR